MDWQAINALAEKMMLHRKEHKERERGFIYYHGQRVGEGAVTLRKLVFPDDPSHDDTIRLAGVFHDVGKGMNPHCRYGAVIFREAVQDLVPVEMIEECAEIIAQHPNRLGPESTHNPWIKLVQDADLLDHSGCYGLWMNAQHYSYFDGCMQDGIVKFGDTIDKYQKENMPLLNYDISKEILKDKLDFERAFFSRARTEAFGHYILPER